MAANRHKEALTVAKNAHKTMGANPRTLTVRLYNTKYSSNGQSREILSFCIIVVIITFTFITLSSFPTFYHCEISFIQKVLN